MAARILLVEDDPGIGTAVQINLKLEGFDVTWARSLRLAREAAPEQFDLIVLDRGLPDGDGLTFCRALRDGGSRVPVLMLTAQTDEDSVVAGLGAGANDYVRKPFGNQELLARVRVALGVSVAREDNLRFGDLTLSRAQRRARVGAVDLDLSPTEFAVLLVLAENGAGVVTRERLMAHLDDRGEITDRTLDSHLSHVRKKFKKLNVETLRITSVYGVGYVLEKS